MFAFISLKYILAKLSRLLSVDSKTPTRLSRLWSFDVINVGKQKICGYLIDFIWFSFASFVCCVFWTANRLFAGCLLVDIIFFRIITSFQSQLKKGRKSARKKWKYPKRGLPAFRCYYIFSPKVNQHLGVNQHLRVAPKCY